VAGGLESDRSSRGSPPAWRAALPSQRARLEAYAALRSSSPAAAAAITRAGELREQMLCEPAAESGGSASGSAWPAGLPLVCCAAQSGGSARRSRAARLAPNLTRRVDAARWPGVAGVRWACAGLMSAAFVWSAACSRRESRGCPYVRGDADGVCWCTRTDVYGPIPSNMITTSHISIKSSVYAGALCDYHAWCVCSEVTDAHDVRRDSRLASNSRCSVNHVTCDRRLDHQSTLGLKLVSY